MKPNEIKEGLYILKTAVYQDLENRPLGGVVYFDEPSLSGRIARYSVLKDREPTEHYYLVKANDILMPYYEYGETIEVSNEDKIFKEAIYSGHNSSGVVTTFNNERFLFSRKKGSNPLEKTRNPWNIDINYGSILGLTGSTHLANVSKDYNKTTMKAFIKFISRNPSMVGDFKREVLNSIDSAADSPFSHKKASAYWKHNYKLWKQHWKKERVDES